MTTAVKAIALRLNAKVAEAASLAPAIEARLLTRGPDDAVVEIKAAGVNPSDVKAATGLTFRRFKQWSALQHAARQIAAGELVRTAAMDAGFADTAHLTRTFRASFGLTPSEAIAGGAQAGAS